MFLGARGVKGGQFLAHFGAKRPSKVKNEDKSLKTKVMAFFGQNKLEPIPPHQKNGFLGVRGVGGAHFRPYMMATKQLGLTL